MVKRIAFLVLSIFVVSLPSAYAGTDEDIAALQQQVRELTAALQLVVKKLDSINPSDEVNAVQTLSSTDEKIGNWANNTKIKTDLRYRYEMIDEEDDRLAKGEDVRNRKRVRARISIQSKISDALKVEVGLATGGSDATSTNQTFDNSFSTKGINLDLAYFDWQIKNGLSIKGGKMKVPFYRPSSSSLVWDGDLRPEGLHANWRSGPLFANVGAFYIEEDEIDKQEAYLFSTQVGVSYEIGKSLLVTGVSFFNFDGLKNNSLSNLGGFNNRGNTVFNGALENDYEVFEFFGEFKFMIADFKASIFADYIVNKGVDDQANNGDNDTGYLAGFSLAKGSYSAKYSYEDLENDATVSSFSDSDIFGGGTDGKGHAFKMSYSLNKQIKLAFTYFLSEEGGQAPLTSFTDYDRFQADINFKF
ncbi:MAG: hypothetical protein ACI9FB_003660 [Candidatus Azotimanducaceae bacterium]|jgi:hypothetical protein